MTMQHALMETDHTLVNVMMDSQEMDSFVMVSQKNLDAIEWKHLMKGSTFIFIFIDIFLGTAIFWKSGHEVDM